MKNYKKFLSVFAAVILMATFCYAAEPASPNSAISTSNQTRRPMLPLPETKKLPPLNSHSLEEWTKATTSLKEQLKTMINDPSKRALTGSRIFDNIKWMTDFINNYFPNDAQSVIAPLPTLRKEAQNPPYSDEKIQRWFSNLNIMQNDIANRIQTALAEQQPAENIIVPVVPQKQLPENPILLISKEVATRQKPNEESPSEKIYKLEIEVRGLITSILDAIRNNKETSSLIESLKKTRDSIMRSLEIQKNALENTSQSQLITKEIDKINLKINISKTLNNFYAINIQEVNGNEKTTVKNASNFINNFVNHFIEMAALIEKTAFDKYDRKLIEYMINNSFFIKYFAHEDEATTTVVPKEKKEEFYKAYTKIIHNILKTPAVVSVPENPVEQPKEQHPPVIVVPSEPKVEPQPVNVPGVEKPIAHPPIVPQVQPEQPIISPAQSAPQAQRDQEQPAPSFFSSFRTLMSNTWEGIKDFFGRIKSGIASWWFGPKLPTTKEIDKNAILESKQ